MRTKAAPKPKKNTAPRVAYELGLLLSGLLLVLAAIHGSATSHFPVSGIVDDTHAVASGPGTAALAAGDSYPVYRFNDGWKNAIGEARVESATGTNVLLSYDPGRFQYPMGRQGSVIEAGTRSIRINLGTRQGLLAGDELFLFRARELVGKIAITRLDDDASEAEVLAGTMDVATGMTVSEFTVPTQIVVFKNLAITLFEVFAVVLSALAYLVAWWRLKRSPFDWTGDRLRTLRPALDRPALRFSLNAIIGVPAVWFSTQFCAEAARYLATVLTTFLARLGVQPAEGNPPFGAFVGGLDRYLWIGYLGFAALYLFALFRGKASPLIASWKKIGFKGGPLKGMPPGPARDWMTWMLHLVIAYFFAYSILTFIQLNIEDAISIAWPNSGIRFAGAFDLRDLSSTQEFFRSVFAGLGHMLTHSPRFLSVEAAFVVIRDILWSLTIVVCLYGYCHSIFGYLWGKKIRNLDFTVPGWVTNGICYGPLLGGVLANAVWRTPGTHFGSPTLGPDPIFASGAVLHLDLVAELFLNILYILTILNLGTMFGVMTDKGVRRTGFYAVVRHPSYTAESLMFIAISVRGFTSAFQWVGASVIYLFAYWLRSEREDNFMTASNPEFADYKAQTPYKFIPGIY